MIRFARSARGIAVVVAWLVAAAAHAQGYANAAYGLALTPPAGWVVAEEIDEDQILFLTLVLPTQDAGIAIGAERLRPADLADGGLARRDAEEREASAGIGEQFGGAMVTFEFAVVVGGEEALGFDFEAPSIHGRELFVVHGGVLYTMAVFGQPAVIEAAAEDTFDGVIDSIVFGTVWR
jgi:hypothetical protein